MAQPLDNSPCTRVPLTYLESLLSVWCDPCPPWSQVACKLTSPSPFPPHSLSRPRRFPNSTVRPSTTTSRHRLHLVWHSNKHNPCLIVTQVTCLSPVQTSLVQCLWSTDIHQIISSTDQHYRSFQYIPITRVALPQFPVQRSTKINFSHMDYHICT